MTVVYEKPTILITQDGISGNRANAFIDEMNAGVAATALDAAATAADRVQTGLDRAVTAADRVQTVLAAAEADAARDEALLYGGVQVDTMADLYALTSGQVAVGKYVQVKSIDDWFKRLASGGDLTHTASVLAWQVLPGADGYDVRAFGAVGDGVADDTAAIRAALNKANALRVAGLVSTILHPGATVVVPPLVYLLTSIAATLPVNCNMSASGAKFVVPAAYAGEVMRVGDDRAGYNLSMAKIEMPDVYKTTGSAIVAGSVGIRTANCNKCRITYGRVSYFDYNLHFGGIGEGTVYCDLFIGPVNYGNQLIRIVPGTGGWFNSNTIYSGQLRQGGSRVTGQYHVYMDGSTSTAIVGNTFIAPAYEGDGAEYIVFAKGAYGNQWVGPYVESGYVGAAVTVSGDTLTRTAHGLAINDMVMFSATVLPTGMTDLTRYYVVSVPTADSYKVSRSKGGAAITFSTAGTAVKHYRQGRCFYDPTGTLTYDNRWTNRFSPPSVLVDHIETGFAANNGEDGYSQVVRDAYIANDEPFYAVRNRSTGVSRPGFAAYPAAVNPKTDPLGWTTALGDQGLMFGAAGLETGRLFNSSGILFYEANNTGTSAQVPTGFRSASFTTLGTTSVAAGARNIQTLTVTGAATGDYVVPMTNNALPDGIIISWARVSAANTVSICFNNVSAGAIDLVGAQLKALVYRSTF